MTFYETLNDLPLHNWDRYMSTDDNNWFIVDYDGKQEKIKNDKLCELATIFKDEYFGRVGGYSFESRLKKHAKRDYLVLKYDTVKTLIELMTDPATCSNMEIRFFCIQSLKKFRFTIPEINTVEGDIQEVNRIIGEMEGIITHIEMLNDELKSEPIKGSSLSKELIMVSVGLELGYKIDSKETSVNEWLDMIDMLKEKNERLEKLNKN